MQRGGREEFAQRRELVRRRALVHAVQRRMPLLGQEVRRADVGREHALLDQLVRVVARRGNDARDLAVLVEFDRELDRVEVDRAALFARGGERLVQRVQVREMRQQRLRFGALGGRWGRQPRPHLV